MRTRSRGAAAGRSSAGRRRAFAGLALVAGLAACGGPEVSPLRQAEAGVMCMCPDDCNKVLANCECGDKPRYTAELAALLDAGKTPREAIDAYAAKYGRLALAAPTGEGFDLLAWTVPFLTLGLAVPVVVVVARRLGGREADPHGGGASAPATPRSGADGTEDARLDAELDRELGDLDR